LAILANSRPFEGLLVSVPTGVFLLLHIISQRGQALWLSMRRTVIPIAIVLALTILGMGFYNLRVTGNPLHMPYLAHDQKYAMVPLFLWQKLPPEPEYRHKVIRDVHATYFVPFHTSKQSIPGFLLEDVYPLLSMKFWTLNIFLLPVITSFPVLIPWMMRNRWARIGVLTQLILVLGLLTEPFRYMHYSAPIIALNYYFVQRAVRLTRWRNTKFGHFVLPLTLFLAITLIFVSVNRTINKERSTTWQNQRAELLKKLKQQDGRHLVIVSYGNRHSYHDEWVYNEADIDGAKVVFARAMNSKQDCQLAEYFKSHRIWSLEVDGDQSMPKLKPYPLSLCK
jgi:hypothetical protein